MLKIFKEKDDLLIREWILTKLQKSKNGSIFCLILDSHNIIDNLYNEIRSDYCNHISFKFGIDQIKYNDVKVIFFNSQRLSEILRGYRFTEIAIKSNQLFSLDQVVSISNYLRLLESSLID